MKKIIFVFMSKKHKSLNKIVVLFSNNYSTLKTGVLVCCLLFMFSSFYKETQNTYFEDGMIGGCLINRDAKDIDILNKSNLCKDSIFMLRNPKLSNDKISFFEIYNTTDKTVYLYSGLFIDDWMKQPYVNQYDSINHSYILSLTPLYKSLINFYQYNLTIDAHYNWYSFIELKSNQYFQLKIHISNNFYDKKNNGIYTVNPKEFEKVLESPFISLKEQTVKNKLLRLGVYQNINNLCNNKIIRYDSIVKMQENFKVISVKW